jgi:hypothetical protein
MRGITGNRSVRILQCHGCAVLYHRAPWFCYVFPCEYRSHARAGSGVEVRLSLPPCGRAAGRIVNGRMPSSGERLPRRQFVGSGTTAR